MPDISKSIEAVARYILQDVHFSVAYQDDVARVGDCLHGIASQLYKQKDATALIQWLNDRESGYDLTAQIIASRICDEEK
jgi:hypothetical protein